MAKKKSNKLKKLPWSNLTYSRLALFDIPLMTLDIEYINRPRNNKYSFGAWINKTAGNLSNWNADITEDFMGSLIGLALGNLGIKSKGIGGIANTAATAIGGLLAGQNLTGVGKALQGIGSLASNIPGIGGVIGAGVNLVGGLVNAAFGSKLNKENIALTESKINELNSFQSNVGDYDALASNYLSAPSMGYFSKDFIGSDGWFSNKAKNKWKELRAELTKAEDWIDRSLMANASNIASTTQQMLEANYSANGGPINMLYTGVMSPFGNLFKDGGIYIKPSKRGTFTTAAKKRGLGVQEFASKVLANKEDYSPAMVKKANFARNASKWHDDGGPLESIVELVNSKDANFVRRLKDPNRKHIKDWESDAIATHKLGVSTDEKGNNYIYPEVQEINGNLIDFTRPPYHPFAGMISAEERGDTVRVNSIEDGLLFTENYKNFYPKGKTFDKGGPLTHGGIFSNGVEYIGNGGTHELNPNEGVLMGIDPQGIPNLVEEGEVIWNDYVFSNRLKAPKTIRLKYKLKENITFADAAKYMLLESEERPNDPISQDGLNALLSDLAMAQEEIRVKKESNKFAKGGKLGKLYSGTGPYSNYLDSEEYNEDDIIGYTKRGALMDDGNIVSFSDTPEVVTSDRTVTDITSRNGKTGNKTLSTNWLRYAPIIGHGLSVFSDLFSSPDYSAAELIEGIDIYPTLIRHTPISNYLRYEPLDRNFYLNKMGANAAAARRAIANTAGGNRAAAMAGILSADYGAMEQYGNLARQAEEYDQALRERVEAFNRGTNLSNAEASLKAQMANADIKSKATLLNLNRAMLAAALRQAAKDTYNARRSNNLNVLLEELGGLGTENTFRSMIDWMADRGVLKVDSEGNYILPKDSNQGAKGGKLKTKKKKGFTYG